MGKETKRKLQTGDRVRVRITAVSLGRSGGSGKIGVTARQPFLGKFEWIRKDVEKMEATGAEEAGDVETAAGEAEKCQIKHVESATSYPMALYVRTAMNLT